MKEQTIAVEESHAAMIYHNFHYNCETMNETVLTTALGEALARCNALEAERDRLVQTLEGRAALELEMLEGVARENDALRDALEDLAKFARTSHNGAPGPRSCLGCALLEKYAALLAEGESRVPDSEVKN